MARPKESQLSQVYFLTSHVQNIKNNTKMI